MNIVQKKLLSSYSIPIAKTISLITFADDAEPVGSFAYKILFPGDIDIREQITECCNLAHAVHKIANDIRNLVKNLISQPGYYLADFKAGINKEFDPLDYGYILRWNENEILRGYKILPNGIRYTLEEALTDPTIVKLDIWAPVDGRYVEASNFMILVLQHEDGSKELINGPQPDYIESIKADVTHYFSKQYLNAFKATKRMFLLAKAYNDTVMLSRIIPLINSGAGAMYQIVSDMNTLVEMIGNLENRTPYDYLYKEIDNFRTRLSYIHEFQFNEGDVDAVIQQINNTRPIGPQLMMNIEHMHQHLLEALNDYVIQYDLANKIYPPNSDYSLQ
jgi:hypothetical protein